ncbi:MAG: CPBP family intramembrane glutamic endopeptidase [Acidimicrobiales bacterium]|jgi:membrane protease YdiL (CAAX protease family)
MHVAAAGLATLLAVVLVAVQPLLGRRRYRRLVERVKTDPKARERHYLHGIVGEWSYVAVVVIIGAVSGRGATSIRLTLRTHGAGAATIAIETVVLAAVALGATTFFIRRAGPSVIGQVRRQAKGFLELLPRTREEKVLFAGMALTAGICEEILYRGFGIAYLEWLLPGASRTTIILVIAVSFGIVHLYQGPRNIVLTGAIGGLLAWITLSTGTLVPAIVIHVLVDLRVVALPASVAEPSPTAGSP